MSTCPKPDPFVLDPKMVYVRTSHGTGISRYEPVDLAALYSKEWAEAVRLRYEMTAVYCDLVDVPEAFGRYVHRENVDRLRTMVASEGRTATFADCPADIDPAGEWAMMSVTVRETAQ